MSGPNDMPPPARKKRGGHAHHGGAWKVAYADFVTAMMALFMVLWLVAQTDEEQREAISEYFRTGILSGGRGVSIGRDTIVPTGRGGSGEDRRALDAQASQIEMQLRHSMAQKPEMAALSDHVEVRVTPDGLLIEVSERSDEDVVFDLSSSSLKPGLVALLEELAPLLGAMPNAVRIDGHTDARPFAPGSGRSNWMLSFERGDRARRVLEAHGLRPGQIVGVFAHGPSQLLRPDDPLSSENRRIGILAVRPTPPEDEEAATPPQPPAAPPPSPAPGPPPLPDLPGHPAPAAGL